MQLIRGNFMLKAEIAVIDNNSTTTKLHDYLLITC
jgi:hypothetical protein